VFEKEGVSSYRHQNKIPVLIHPVWILYLPLDSTGLDLAIGFLPRLQSIATSDHHWGVSCHLSIPLLYLYTVSFVAYLGARRGEHEGKGFVRMDGWLFDLCWDISMYLLASTRPVGGKLCAPTDTRRKRSDGRCRCISSLGVLIPRSVLVDSTFVHCLLQLQYVYVTSSRSGVERLPKCT